MAYSTTSELQELYFQHSFDHIKPNYEFRDSLLQWPFNNYFNRFKPDAFLLDRSLSIIEKPSHSIAEQVFGNQKEQQYIGLKHTANLLYERAILHQQHTRDIDHRHMQIQEKLFGVQINNFPDKARRQSNLESQLLQLEQQRRDEELAFWKDSTEIRDKLFENAVIYKTIKNRYSVFSDVENQYD
ncbi:hypothetical protein ACFLZ8_03935 [Planctomycetota bacterium]